MFSAFHTVTFVISMPLSKLAVFSLYNYLHLNNNNSKKKKKGKKKKTTRKQTKSQ